jgi:hypothetical protein
MSFFSRLRRRDQASPSTPAANGSPGAAKPAITVHHCVQDFFVFRDVLFVRGMVERRGQTPTIKVRRKDGSVLPARPETDDFNPSTEAHWWFHFHVPLPPKLSHEEIAGLSLVFEFEDGVCEIKDPTAAGVASDPFVTSEKDYWAAVAAAPHATVLEIGSRARSGISRRHLFPPTSRYTGFDILPGENVDVTGDAHTLSKVLPHEHFDFVFSVSVWEHLAMPWLVSLELNKVMRTGGLAMINTHQSWPVHEAPWDFFRFSDYSWAPLFNPATGFKIVARGMGMRAVMGPNLYTPGLHDCRVEWHYGCLASRVVVQKIGPSTLSWPVDPATVSEGIYPH